MTTRSSEYAHLIRMAALFAVGITAFVILRWAMVPAGFGEYGHFRPGALQDNAAHPLKFAGQAACLDCHADIGEIRAQGRHAHVACEACHGPLARHAADPGAVTPEKPDPRKTCLICHTASMTKPKTFPQVDVAEHAPEGPCTECHAQPHNPKIS